MSNELSEQELKVLKDNLPQMLANYKAICSTISPPTLASEEAFDLMGWSIKELALKYGILPAEELNDLIGVGTTRAQMDKGA